MSKNEENEKDNKYKKLGISVLLDGVGYLSYVIPVVAEFTDIIWAPISAWIMMKLYKGTTGKVAGGVSFLEEIFVGVDFIPTFTITWLYTYVFKGEKKSDTIDVNHVEVDNN